MGSQNGYNEQQNKSANQNVVIHMELQKWLTDNYILRDKITY